MQPLDLIPENITKAEQYLASINKLQEFRDKKIDPSQWSAVILFANQQIQIQNQSNNGNDGN